MSQSLKKELLEELKQRVIDYVEAERVRLKIESTFLQSVLDSSLGGATQKQDEEDKLQSIGNVRRFLGIQENRS